MMGNLGIEKLQRRLKRIKDRFREMTLWFEQVMLEDADDDGDDVTPVEEEKAAPENQQEEDEQEEEEEEEDVQAGLEITAVTKVLLVMVIFFDFR